MASTLPYVIRRFMIPNEFKLLLATQRFIENRKGISSIHMFAPRPSGNVDQKERKKKTNQNMIKRKKFDVTRRKMLSWKTR